MFPTFEATVDEKGNIQPEQKVQLKTGQRLLVTIVGDATGDSLETMILSERTLMTDWGRTEEDEAWKHLQPGQSF